MQAPRARPARVRRPAPRRRPAPLHRRGPGASRRVAAPLVLRALVPADRRRRAGGARAAARRDAPLSVAQTYTHYLPCAAQAGKRGGRARARRRLPRARARGHHLLQPDDLHRPIRLRRGGGHRRARQEPGGQPYVYRYSTLEQLPRLAVRLHAPRRARPLRPAAARGGRPTATTAGWRTSASTRRSTPAPPTARSGSAPAQPLSAPVPLRRIRRRGRRAGGRSRGSRARAGPAPRAARRSSGAATRPSTGASTACARWSTNGLTMGLSGVSTLGL